MTIGLANQSLGFSTLIFNLDVVNNGTATFSATDQFGTVFNFGPFNVDGNGENFFRLGSLDGQVATSFSILASVGIENISDLDQVRLGATNRGTPVPEPASLTLFGAGLVGLGMVRRRRNKAA